MKNIFILLAPLALMLSGCVYEELTNNESEPADGRIFTAFFEQNDTRTYVEEGNLLRWNAGDEISLFDGNTLNRQYKFDGETGDNSGTFSIVSKPFGTGNDLTANYAVYPYGSNIKITEAGVITVTVPAEQSYVKNSFGLNANTMVAATKDTDDTFLKFKNACGYLKLQLYGDDVTVKSITLTGNNNEKIAGNATITPTYSQDPTTSMNTDATESITLDCGEGVTIGTTPENATSFWIVVPPTSFENGFEITITAVNGGTMTKSTSNEIVIKRNVIKPMTAFEVEIEKTIPYSQIFYTYSGDNGVSPSRNQAFLDVDGKMLTYTNEYADGTGIITFDGILSTLGQNAFYNNSNLTSVTIPDGVTTIERGAFSYCSNLTNITFPNSVTTIEMEAIEGCPSISKFNGKFSTADGYCLIADDTLIAFAAKCGATEYTIPENVTNIGNIAFKDCRTLESITIPNNVVAIGHSAFYYCPSLKNVTIGNRVVSIGNYAFGSCTSLTSITIPNNVIEIGTGAFSGCDKIREFRGKHATNDGYALIVDGTLNAFAPECGATQYSIPDNVTEIGYAAFYGCESLTSITIPSSVTTINNNAFSFCDNLKDIFCNAATPPYIGYNSIFTLDSGDKIYVYKECVDLYKSTWNNYSKYIYENGSYPDNTTTTIYYTTSDGQTITSDKLSIKSNTYSNNQGKMVVYGNLGHIPIKAFNQCSNLTSITIPNTVTAIRESAFMDCQNLTTVTIGNGVVTIGDNAFNNCNQLVSVILGESLTTIGEQAFLNCKSLTSVVIPNSVTTIGNNAFRFCSSLTSVSMGNSVTTIGLGVFTSCSSLEEFKGKHASIDGRSLIIDNKIAYYAPASGTEYTIPGEVVSIGNQAFATCDKLTSITIPETVTTIEANAFVYCLSLTKVTIPKAVKEILYGAFNYCSSLATIKVEATTPPTLYDNLIFSGCSNDLKVYVPIESVSAYSSADYWEDLTILSDTE